MWSSGDGATRSTRHSSIYPRENLMEKSTWWRKRRWFSTASSAFSSRALVRWLWLLAAAATSIGGCRRAGTAEVDGAPIPRLDPEVVSFRSGTITLQGVLYKP